MPDVAGAAFRVHVPLLGWCSDGFRIGEFHVPNVMRSRWLSERLLLLIVALFLHWGPVEPLVAAALLAWLLFGLVAVLGGIRCSWRLHQRREGHDNVGCVRVGLSLDLVDEESSGHRTLWASNVVVDVVLGMVVVVVETALYARGVRKVVLSKDTRGFLRGSRLKQCQC